MLVVAYAITAGGNKSVFSILDILTA